MNSPKKSIVKSKTSSENQRLKPKRIKFSLGEFEENKINFEDMNKFNKTETNFRKEFKPDVSEILKKVLEKNKKEAAAKNREILSSAQGNLNMQRKTNSAKTFIENTSNLKRFGELNKNSISFNLEDRTLWRKHEELWSNAINPSFTIGDLEKYIIPPNDSDVLLSIYYKLNSINTEEIKLSCNIENPKYEIKKMERGL